MQDREQQVAHSIAAWSVSNIGMVGTNEVVQLWRAECLAELVHGKCQEQMDE